MKKEREEKVFEKSFRGTILVFVAMLVISGNVLAQKFDPANPEAKFPAVDLLPMEFQVEAKRVQSAYLYLLEAKKESAKAFERLKEKFQNGRPVEVRFYLRLYDRADIQHRRYWEETLWRILDASNLGDALIFQEVTPGQFKLNENQINQYEKWTYFVEESWEWAAPPEKLKEEDKEFLQKARSKADLKQLFSR